MNIIAILELVNKGLSIASALISAGQSAEPAISALKNLTSTPNEPITDAQLDRVEAMLDAQIEEFNLEMSK